MRMTRGIVVVLSALVLSSLTACGPGTASTPSPTVDQSATATPTPDPSVTPIASPALAFGGDCAAVVPGAAAPADFPWMLSVAMAGGIRCQRNGYDMIVVQEDAVAASSDPALSSATCRRALWGECVVGEVVNGYWFVAIMDEQLAADAILAEFASSAGGVAAPGLVSRPADAWTVPDCSTISPAGVTLGDTNGPRDPVAGAIDKAVGYRECANTDLSQLFTVAFLPGGAWAGTVAAALPGAVAVTVPGADGAWVAPAAGTMSYLYVTSGSNLLILQPNSSDVTAQSLVPVATDLLATLD